ncbi:MAG: IS1595 family transposase [Candidatus Berkelbacteria bacterium]
MTSSDINKVLIAGYDYPDTYREFVEMFPDNIACAAFMEKLRWPNGFICPRCNVASKPWYQTRNRLVCPHCRFQTSVCAGTIFEKTRTPLITWFEAAWHVTTAKNGLSAKTLERTLGTTYRVAWAMLQRFRIAMVRSERELLSGVIEVDETFVGGVGLGSKRGRGTDKCIIAVAVEVKSPKGFGRVRLRYIPDASGDNLISFVSDSVLPGSTIHTDGWNGYNRLSEAGYHHIKTIQSESESTHVSMKGVHRIAALLKRWILGTHQGSITSEHLQSYLEEYTFRFNRRASSSRGLVFYRLIEQSVNANQITEADLIHGYNWDEHDSKSSRRS